MRDITEKSLENKLRAEAAEARAKRLRVALEKIEQGDYERIGRNFYNTITRTPSKHDTCPDLQREDAHERKRLESEYPWKERT